MSDRLSIKQIITACERYWLETKVPRSVSMAMKLELESHLHDAAAAGKEPATVIGDDLASFAESWASEFRSPAWLLSSPHHDHHRSRQRPPASCA